MVSCLFTAPSVRAPFFPSFQASCKNRLASTPAALGLPRCASVSPSRQKPGTATSREMRAGERSGPRQTEEGDLGKSGPYASSEPRSPSLPSPAWHLSRQITGPPRAEHAPCVPAHQPKGVRGLPGERTRGDPAEQGGVGSAQSGMLGREAGEGPQLQRGCL